jgi:hypothetical protein
VNAPPRSFMNRHQNTFAILHPVTLVFKIVAARFTARCMLF